VLVEGSPGTKLSLAQEIAATAPGGRAIIVGVPAAFSPACSAAHVPGYMAHAKVRSGEAGAVFVVSVNDAFV